MALDTNPKKRADLKKNSTGANPLRNSQSPESVGGLISYFLLSCKIEGKSPLTISHYNYHLSEFIQFCEQQHFPTRIRSIDSYHIRLFINQLQERGLEASTVHSYHRGLHSFFSWLVRERYLKEHPMLSMKPPKVPKKIVKPLTNEHISRVLFCLCDNSYVSVRNRAIFLVFLDTGLRLDEMARIKVEDVDWDQGVITVMGKGGKERRVRIGRTTHKALLRYKAMRQEPDPELWISEERKALARDGIRSMIQKTLVRAGIHGVKLGPHTLRHTAAISYLRNQGDVFTLQIMLGHAQLSTTQMYLTSLGTEDLLRVHEKASPVDNLNVE